MAIYINEEKNKNGGKWFSFIFIVVVLSIVGVASYYIFFVKPEIIKNITVPQLQSIDRFSNIKFDPKDVVNSDFFKNLKQFVQQSKPKPAGNSSPFGVF